LPDDRAGGTKARRGAQTLMQRYVGRSAMARYTVAVVLVMAAVLLALAIRGVVLGAAQLLLVAILITGWLSGLRAATLAWVLSMMAFHYFFTPPFDSLMLKAGELPRVALFMVVAGFMATMSAARRSAENALRAAREELEIRVRDRTADLRQSNDQLRAFVAEAVAAQRRFENLVNSVDGIVWEADATTCHSLFASGQAERILGYPATRWISEPTFWLDHVHPDDRPWVVATCQAAARETRERDFEYRMIAADGRVVWLRALVTVMREDTGIRLRGVMVDITARRRADTALREQAGLLELTHDTIFVRDMNDVITYWNRAAEESYGWPAAHAIGKVSHDLMRTIFPTPLADIQAMLLRAGRWEGELVHSRADGSQIVVASRWALQRDEQGEPQAILETNNDITKRKRAEYLTAQVFDTSPDRISIIGRDYRYQRVNPVFERFWGVAAEKAVGMPISDLPGRELLGEVARLNLERCFEGEDVGYAEWLPTPQGRRYVAVTYSPLRPDGKRVEAALVIGRDLTEHMLAAEALHEARAALAHVTRVTTLGELAASIAHEVNQPLTAIVADANASLNWLSEAEPDLDRVRDALGAIVDDGHRAADVIHRIRQLATKTAPHKVAVDINDVIRDVVALVRTEVVKHEVSLRLDLAPGLAAVLADRVQLQQVIINLVLNGIEAMASVADRSRELVLRSGRHGDDRVLVAVRDAGVGIDAASIDKVFNAFFTTKPGGMGMGLSISRSIIDAHGGRLWATPNPVHGATFQFILAGIR